MHLLATHAAAIAALLATSAVAAPAQPTRTFGKPDAEFSDPFTSVTGIRELKDGRVLVIDSRERLVQLVDFKAGRATRVSREGSGPKEYGLPMMLLPLPGDSSAIFDPLNSRLLVITPAGEPGGFIPWGTGVRSANAGPRAMMMGISMIPPRFTDAKGRFYMVGPAMQVGADGQPTQVDSAPILRFDRVAQRTDTLGYRRVPRNNVQTTSSSGNMRMTVGVANPFAARDEWAATSDGRVAVIRAPEYRVDWLAPMRAGSPIPYEKIKVTEQHKQNWRDARRNAQGLMMTVGPEGARRAAVSGPQRNLPDPTDWPDVLPPFLENAVTVAPDGTVWVNRTRSAADETPRYDVIDGSGQVIRRVTLAPKTRVIGFGPNSVYTVRTDADDLQYLQRHRL